MWLFPGAAGERRCREREYPSAVAFESRVDHAIPKDSHDPLAPTLAERVWTVQTIPAVGSGTLISQAQTAILSA
jgi:hypothetical protein